MGLCQSKPAEREASDGKAGQGGKSNTAGKQQPVSTGPPADNKFGFLVFNSVTKVEKVYEFSVSGKSLKKLDLRNESDTMFEIYHGKERLYRSEVCQNDANPNWKKFTIPVDKIPEHTATLLFKVWDDDSRSGKGDKDGERDIIGIAELTFKQLSAKPGLTFTLKASKDKEDLKQDHHDKWEKSVSKVAKGGKKKGSSSSASGSSDAGKAHGKKGSQSAPAKMHGGKAGDAKKGDHSKKDDHSKKGDAHSKKDDHAHSKKGDDKKGHSDKKNPHADKKKDAHASKRRGSDASGSASGSASHSASHSGSASASGSAARASGSEASGSEASSSADGSDASRSASFSGSDNGSEASH